MAPIPPFERGVLPPYLDAPTSLLRRSPYEATAEDVARHFATSAVRRDILRGYLAYRAELRRIGLDEGFQWLGGSFVEDVELTRGRPPNDLDVVTFFRRPPGTDVGWETERYQQAPYLFDAEATRALFMCDAYVVGLVADDPEGLVPLVTYWYGLFSHLRNGLWKGMIQVALATVDGDGQARRLLGRQNA